MAITDEWKSAGSCDGPHLPPDHTHKFNTTVLQEAEQIVAGEGREQYGTAERSCARIAKLWSVALGTDVTPRQVTLCMILLKVARDVHHPKRDNLVDIAGYARLAEMLEGP